MFPSKNALVKAILPHNFRAPFKTSSQKMKTLATPAKRSIEFRREEARKPPFRPAKDDTKPPLRDPILRSDPIETEEAILRLPPLPDIIKST